MKTFDQLSPESQVAIKHFKNNFCNFLEKMNRWTESNQQAKVVMITYLGCNGCNPLEIDDILNFLSSKHYFMPFEG